MMAIFLEMTLTRKAVVCFMLLLAVLALFDSNKGWVGAVVITWTAYLIVKLSKPKSSTYHQEPTVSDSDDWYRRQQEEDDAYSIHNAEEERVNKENRTNQEALDRLL